MDVRVGPKRRLGWGERLVTKLCLTLATPWTVACQAPLSMGFSRQDYWSGLPFPSPGDLPNPGIEPRSPVLQAYRHMYVCMCVTDSLGYTLEIKTTL